MQPDAALIPTGVHGWRTGFGNMFRKEHGVWWRTSRWAIHLVLWVVVINGFLLLVTLGNQNARAPSHMKEIFEVFFRVGGLFASIGVVTVTQGLLVGEKQIGTLAWLLTKPVSRPAIVLAKWCASIYVVLYLMLLVPAALVNVLTRLVWGEWPRMPGYLIGVGLLALSHVFYVTFVLMLGTLFQRRGSVSGVAIGFLMAGLILPNFVPKWVMLGTPWMLHQIAAAQATGAKLPPEWTTPVLMTAIWIVVCMAVALWRFEREEF